MRVTSAAAAKLVRELNEKIKEKKEEIANGSVFRCAVGEDEDSVRPDFNLKECLQEIDEMETELRSLKHKINDFNAKTVVDQGMTIDMVLIRLPQLTERKRLLESLSGRLRKQRVTDPYMRTGNVIDYEVANYDLAMAKEELKEIRNELFSLQEKLNVVNSTVEFEI